MVFSYVSTYAVVRRSDQNQYVAGISGYSQWIADGFFGWVVCSLRQR